jgi:hypothetical protein
MTRTLVLLTALLAPTVAAAATVKASSELKDSEGKKHTADMAFDGLLQTGWAEADVGPGAGSWVELKLDKATDVQSVSVWAGNLVQGQRSLKEFGRPKVVTVTLTTKEGPVTQQVRLLDGATEGPQRVDVPIAGQATAVKVTLDEVYEGGVFNDTYVAEIGLNFNGGERPSQVDTAVKWQGTDAAEKAAEKNKTQIVAWFDAISAAEFGDADTLAKIMDQAADGAPFMRDRARNVPYGWRVLAVPPDDVAIEAIMKLKDANAIPALEMAALRVPGKDANKLREKGEMLEAYAELASGGNRNVQNWGESGWEVGALRSFKEPLNLQIDQFGDIYVADVGNHRVQRFDRQGKATRQWGGEPGISNVWFGKTRKYYVAGSTPGEKAGQFSNPVDLAMVPGKKADGMVVLDAKGRVTRFDEEGKPVISWNLRTDDGISAGVGQEGYIEYLKGDKILVAWGRDCFLYDLNAEELATWQIAVNDGTPNGSVALRNGKVAFIFGRQLVMYSPTDGFRHGNLLGEAAELGEGFEDWDVTLDQDGKLWAVTDRGLAVKYKKPGKVDYTVQITDYELESPRLAVYDDLVFVTDRDAILKVDALELKAKAELAAQDAAAEPPVPE